MMFGYLLYKMSKEKMIEDDGQMALGFASFFELVIELIGIFSVLARHVS